MGAGNHKTTVPGNFEQGNEDSGKWAATLHVNGTAYHKVLEADGPRRVQALNQVWKQVPDYLEEHDIDAEPREVNLTLIKNLD